MSDEAVDGEARLFTRRLLKHQQDAVDNVVLKAAFRMVPDDRRGPIPHGISTHECPDRDEDSAKDLHTKLNPTTNSGKPLGLGVFFDNVVDLANSKNNDPHIKLLPNRDSSDEVQGDYHYLLTCQDTDVAEPTRDQGFPTTNQAIILAQHSKLIVPCED